MYLLVMVLTLYLMMLVTSESTSSSGLINLYLLPTLDDAGESSSLQVNLLW